MIGMQSRTLVEAESKVRNTGVIPPISTSGYEVPYERMPVCFVNAISFTKIFGRPPGESERLEEFTKERDCKSFTPWIQGHTPREHREMLISEASLKRQQEFDERMARDSRRHNWLSLLFTVVGIGVAIYAATRDQSPRQIQLSPQEIKLTIDVKNSGK